MYVMDLGTGGVTKPYGVDKNAFANFTLTITCYSLDSYDYVSL
jgi:hypothetical protein